MGVNNSSITCEVIQRFNDKISRDEYADLRELFKDGINEISVFDDQDRDGLTKNVSSLKWDKVIVSLTPINQDEINISDVFAQPRLTAESSSNEFVRMYYVACSKAREDLYIHIPSGCSKDTIASSLDTYIQNVGCKLEYEFPSSQE